MEDAVTNHEMNDSHSPTVNGSASHHHHHHHHHHGVPIRKLVLSEIHFLIIAMRTSARFSPKSRFQNEVPRKNENPLIASLKDVRDQIVTESGWQSMTVLSILQPFFDIVQSEDTTGPVTGVALQSIQKFLEHPWLTSKTDGAKIVMKEIVKSVKMCQFEVTDATTDEAILIKVLQLFVACVRCDLGVHLDEQNVLQVMKSCFRIGRETRPTELLRRSAENSLHEITEIVFRRIRDEQWLEMPEIFKFICDMCDPEEAGKSTALRLIGLTLANVVMDIMGPSIAKFPHLLAIVQDKLCRSLLRNSVTSNIVVLSQTLRGMHTLMTCIAPYIHEQIEAFIISTHLRIADSKQSSSYEHQELVLEFLVELCCDTSFTAYLYEHYDCHDHSADIFEQTCKFLAKNIKESESINALHILSLQGLLGIINGIAERCTGTTNTTANTDSNDQQEEREDTQDMHRQDDDSSEVLIMEKVKALRQRKIIKRNMMTAAAKFNQDPKEGLVMLSQPGVFSPEAATPREIAHFLRTYNNWLNKHSIGEVIMKNDPFHEQILMEYLRAFEFKGIMIDEALRFVLHTFKLVGEAQQMEQVMKYFGYAYFDANSENTFLDSRDASWLYAVAVLMLHTDLHNQQNRNKMTLEQWISNVRHLDDVKNIPVDELERVYAAIMTKEFQLSNNFSDAYKSDPAWEEILRKSRSYALEHHEQSLALIPSPLEDYLIDEMMQQTKLDSDMFQSIWSDVIIATSIVLENTIDDSVKQNCIRGFRDCARIAAHYRHSNVFDTLVISLCKFTKVLHTQHEDAVAQFGQRETPQLAAKIVFQMTRKYGDNLREGWRNILDLMLRMYELDLLPESLLGRESFLADICSKKPIAKKQQSGGSGSGAALYLFGFFGSNDDSLVNKKYIEIAEKCIEQCRIADMLNDVKFLHESSLEFLVKALIFGSNGNRGGSDNGHDDHHRDHNHGGSHGMGDWMSVYTRMFCLDLLTDITISNKDRIMLLWKYVYEHFRNTISDVCTIASRKKTTKLTKDQLVTLERVVVCIFRIYVRLMYREDIHGNINQAIELLDLIPEGLLLNILPQICAGLLVLAKTGQTIESPRVWELVMRLLKLGLMNRVGSAVEAVILLTSSGTFIWPDAIGSLVHALLIVHDIKTVELLHSLHTRMLVWREEHCQDEHIDFGTESTWHNSWMTLLAGLGQLCCSQDDAVRNSALITMQRILLDNSLQNSKVPFPVEHLVILLTDVVIRMMDLLLKTIPQSHQYNRASSIEDSRFRAVTILAKTFLSFLPSLVSLDRKEFGQLWLEIMAAMRCYALDDGSDGQANVHGSGGGNNMLAEAIPELVKNLILVMNTQPQTQQLLQELWPETKIELQRFYPQLILEFQQQQQEQEQEQEQHHQQEDHSPSTDQEISSSPVKVAEEAVDQA